MLNEGPAASAGADAPSLLLFPEDLSPTAGSETAAGAAAAGAAVPSYLLSPMPTPHPQRAPLQAQGTSGKDMQGDASNSAVADAAVLTSYLERSPHPQRVHLQAHSTSLRDIRRDECSSSQGGEREREKERALLGTISITGWSRARPGDRRCLAL